MMAAENYLLAKGLNNLDPEEFQKHVMEFATGKTLEEIQMARNQLDANKKSKPMDVITIASDAEEELGWNSVTVKKEDQSEASELSGAH